MKTMTNKFIAIAFATVLVFAGLFAGANMASAAASFVGGSHDTVRSANYTDCPGCINWYDEGPRYASVAPGEVGAIGVYYKNTGNETATNVRIKISPRNSSSKTNHSFSGSVTADNANTMGGSANIEIQSGSQELRFVSGSMVLYTNPNSSPATPLGTESDIFSSQGLLIGNVPAGHEGLLVAHFAAGNTQASVAPSVVTLAPQQVTISSALLRGWFDGNGISTRTWFEYSTSQSSVSNGSGTPTSKITRGSGSGNFSDSVTGLNTYTTYYYRACAENTFNQTVCDGIQSFRTLRDATPPPPPPADVEVKTNSATGIDEDSATLRGEVLDGINVTTWFALTTNSNPNCSSSSQRESVSGLYNAGSSFSINVTGLSDNTTYYFRACGEDSAGNSDDGAIYSFTTDDEYVAPDEQPDVTTLSPDEEEDEVTLNGEYDMNDENNGTVFFAWTEESNSSYLDNVRYENDISDINNRIEVEIVENDADAGDRGSVAFTLDDNDLDEDETYVYRLCIEYSNVIICGVEKEFELDIEDENLDVMTDSATNIDEDSATLNGEYEDLDDADVFFIWGEDRNDIDDATEENDIDDIERKSKYRDVEIEIVERGADGSDRSVSERVTGLDDDTRYYFALCAEQDGDLECGSVKSFTTDKDNRGPIDNGNPASLSACSAINVGITTATLRTFYSGDSTTRAYFEYGTTTGFGNRTSSRSFERGSGAILESVSGLLPNTQYYCRITAENDGGTTRSEIGTFRTTALPIIPTTVTNTNTVTRIVTSGGRGDRVILEINNYQEIATRGQVFSYEVTYGSLVNYDLEDVGIFVRLPKAARFISTTKGTYNRRDHAVYVRVGNLEALDEDDFDITVRITGAQEGEPIVAEAVLAFEDPQDGEDAFLNAIEFDSDIYSAGLGLTAGLFGLGLPTTFLGWLLLILVLILLIMAAHYFYQRESERRRRERMERQIQEQQYAQQFYQNQQAAGNGGGYAPNSNGGNGSQYN